MDCGYCKAAAAYICLCVKIRLCDTCVDTHLMEESDLQHQLIPIEECEESYTAQELLSSPQLLLTKLTQELARLEQFRLTVLTYLDTLSHSPEIQGNIDQITELVLQKHSPTREKLELALQTLANTRLIDKLPTEDYPWNLISDPLPPSFLPPSLEIGTFNIDISTAIHTNITWNLPEIEGKTEDLPAIPQPVPAKSEIEEEKIDLPEDQMEKMRILKENSVLRKTYFRINMKNQTWKLRNLFDFDGNLKNKNTIKASGIDKNDTFDLFLVLFCHSSDLKDLILENCSFNSADFTTFCYTISRISLISLVLDRCKLGNTRIRQLKSVLPLSLKRLSLAGNYFAVEELSFPPEAKLESVRLHNVPGVSTWRNCPPDCEVVSN